MMTILNNTYLDFIWKKTNKTTWNILRVEEGEATGVLLKFVDVDDVAGNAYGEGYVGLR